MKALKQYLKKHGHGSGARLAEAVGINPSSLSNIASGRHNPSYDTLVKIARHTGIALSDLTDVPQRGLAEGTVEPFSPRPEQNDLPDMMARLAPDARHRQVYIARSSAPAFGVMAGDLLVIEPSFDPASIPLNAIVVAQIEDASGQAHTTLCRALPPHLADPTGFSIGRIGANAAVVGVVQATARGPGLGRGATLLLTAD